MEADTEPVQTICRACEQPMALRPDGKFTKKGPVLHVCQPQPIDTWEEMYALGFVDTQGPVDNRIALGLISPDMHNRTTRKVKTLATINKENGHE